MDAFDDFEFKPLTEGLGFHKKNSQSSQTLNDKNLPPLEPRPKNSVLENLNLNSKALSFDTPKFHDQINDIRTEPQELPDLAPEVDIFSKPLPRTEQDVPQRQPIATPSTTVIPKFNPRFNKPLVNPSIHEKDTGLLGILEQQAEIKPNKVDAAFEIKFMEVAPSPLALFLDFTVIAGLSILFTLGLVVATNLNIVLILSHIGEDFGVQIGMALLIYSVSQLYLILSRTFYGQTLGEWSMDTQLGLDKEQEKFSYIFKLTARTLILAVTGFVTLPLISIFLEKDISGRISGLKLYRKY